MKGWMSCFNQKADKDAHCTSHPLSNEITQKLWFSLDDNTEVLRGFTDENSETDKIKIDLNNCIILISETVNNQFELIENDEHIVFTLGNTDEFNNWVTTLQNCLNKDKAAKSSNLPTKQLINKSLMTNVNKETTKENIKTKPSQVLHDFEDPLRSSSSFHQPDFPRTSSSSHEFAKEQYEWDSELTSMSSPWIRNENLDEQSAIFQLSKELEDAHRITNKFQLKINSYREVLAARDKQLFDLQDKLCDQEKEAAEGKQEQKKLQIEIKSLQTKNKSLEKEIGLLNKNLKKINLELRNHKKNSSDFQGDVLLYQRDYVDLLGQLVYRPLSDPTDGAVIRVADREKHISAVKSLIRTMKKNNSNKIDFPIPTIGNKEFVDEFQFAHNLPNESIQLEYSCRYLASAFDVLLNEGPDGSTNLLKWKALIAANSDNFQSTNQLKKYILEEMPNTYRPYVWQKLIYHYVFDLRQSLGGDSYYQSLLEVKDDFKAKDKDFAKNFKQIVMDVPRTMPRNKSFCSDDNRIRESLEQVLTAFSLHAPDIGYCQGFNFLAGGALLYLQEEDAFWFLVSVVKLIFPPEYFLNDLAGLRADQEVLTSIVAAECPRLSDHLSRHARHFELSVVTTSWFLGLFFDCMQFGTLVRVWDCLLAFGHEALFRISCAILLTFEDRILEITEPSQLLHAVKNLPRLCVRSDELIKTAFYGLNKFPSWETLLKERSKKEAEFVGEFNVRQEQCQEYKEKIMKIDKKLQDGDDDKLIVDKATTGFGRSLLCASCVLTESSQIYEVNLDLNIISNLDFYIAKHVMCCKLASEDVVIVGLFTGQLKAYSISKCFERWSMSLSYVVLSVEVTDENIFVGTADCRLHVLKKTEGMGKPCLMETTTFSDSPSCMCLIPSQSSLWVSAGPGIYIIDTISKETVGFFLVSVHKDQISAMYHWTIDSDKEGCEPRQLVWIVLESSPVIQLLDACNFKAGPILVFDTRANTSLSLRQPMMRDDASNLDDSSAYIMSISSLSCQQLWLSTNDGHLKRYQVDMVEEAVESIEDEDPSSPVVVPDGKPQFSMTLLSDKNISDKPIRVLVTCNNSILSASGCYGDENTVKRWYPDEDEPVAVTTCQEDDDTSVNILLTSDDGQSFEEDVPHDLDSIHLQSTSINLSSSLPHLPEPGVQLRASKHKLNPRNRTSAFEIGSEENQQFLPMSKSYSTLGGQSDNKNSGETWKSLKNAATNAVNNYKDKGGLRKFIFGK